MSAITEFRIGFSRTINIGNFESIRIEGSVTVALGDDDDLATARAAAQPELRLLIEDTYRAQHKQRN